MLSVPQRYRRTDRQTDGRTTYDSNTALALCASRGKNGLELEQLHCGKWNAKLSGKLPETQVQGQEYCTVSTQMQSGLCTLSVPFLLATGSIARGQLAVEQLLRQVVLWHIDYVSHPALMPFYDEDLNAEPEVVSVPEYFDIKICRVGQLK